MTTLLPSFVRSLRHFYFGIPHFHSLSWAKYYRTTSLKNLNLYESFPCHFFLQTLHFYEFVDLIKFSHFNFSQHTMEILVPSLKKGSVLVTKKSIETFIELYKQKPTKFQLSPKPYLSKEDLIPRGYELRRFRSIYINLYKYSNQSLWWWYVFSRSQTSLCGLRTWAYRARRAVWSLVSI